MFGLLSKLDIERISYEILFQSKALDVFPTPVERIIEFVQLNFDLTIDLSKIDESFLARYTGNELSEYVQAISMIRGFLDRKEKTVYLDLSMPSTRKNFVLLHEVGHDVLPWQKDIMQCIDDDSSLRFEVESEFEAEANYFASITLFQQDRFIHKMNKLPLGISAPMQLAKQFGASNHAALRRYVECSENRCALLVLEKISLPGEFPECSKRDFFQSRSFTETFGEISLPDKFGYTWRFAKEYYHRRRYHENGEITISTENGEVDFNYHFFNSTHNAFVFLFPHGEIQRAKSNLVIVNNSID